MASNCRRRWTFCTAKSLVCMSTDSRKIRYTACLSHHGREPTLVVATLLSSMLRSLQSATVPAQCPNSPLCQSETKIVHGVVCVLWASNNIIQVGALRFLDIDHQSWKFFQQGQGVNHEVHDFPCAEMGLKLGGFMLLHRTGGKKRACSWYDLPGL